MFVRQSLFSLLFLSSFFFLNGVFTSFVTHIWASKAQRLQKQALSPFVNFATAFFSLFVWHHTHGLLFFLFLFFSRKYDRCVCDFDLFTRVSCFFFSSSSLTSLPQHNPIVCLWKLCVLVVLACLCFPSARSNNQILASVECCVFFFLFVKNPLY